MQNDVVMKDNLLLRREKFQLSEGPVRVQLRPHGLFNH